MDQFGTYNGYGGYGSWRPQPPIPPKRGILVVHGQEGINALAMAPNDEAIALDETADIMWKIRTDSAGYKTATPFSIALYQPKPPVNLNEINDRLSRLEEAFNAEHRATASTTATEQTANS
jgi:hypothetical protein